MTAFDVQAPRSTEAFFVLTQSCPEINRAFTTGDLLSTVALEFLSSPHPESLTLYRIAHVTYFVLSSERNGLELCSPYLLQFLDFVDELCILYFYESFCGDNMSFADVQNWLVQMNFSEIVAESLTRPLNVTDAPYLDPGVQRMRHLFILVDVCLKSPILKSSFQEPHVLNALCCDINQLPVEVESERWETLLQVYDESTKNLLSNLFEQAIAAMTTPVTSLSRQVVAAIDLVTKMFTLDDNICDKLIKSSVQNILLNLMMTFPSHTFLQRSALSFILAALSRPTLRLPITDQLVIPLMLEGVDADNPVLVGASFKVMDNVHKIKDKPYQDHLHTIPGFTSFMNTMEPRQKLLASDYGGRRPSVWS